MSIAYLNGSFTPLSEAKDFTDGSRLPLLETAFMR